MKNMKNATTPRFVTSAQLSTLISVPVYTIQQMVREEKLPAYRINARKFLFDVEEVFQTIKNNRA